MYLSLCSQSQLWLCKVSNCPLSLTRVLTSSSLRHRPPHMGPDHCLPLANDLHGPYRDRPSSGQLPNWSEHHHRTYCRLHAAGSSNRYDVVQGLRLRSHVSRTSVHARLETGSLHESAPKGDDDSSSHRYDLGRNRQHRCS